jgi:putative NADH-flavin reductase
MNVAIVGATGNAGSSILAEALRRGHAVTAIARDLGGLRKAKNLVGLNGNVEHPDALAAVLANHDVIVSALRFSNTNGGNVLAAVRASGVKRYLVVGGAGSLLVEPGRTLLDTGKVPAESVPESTAAKEFLDVLRGVDDLDWTMLCPSAYFWAGDRTGTFRLGDDMLLTGIDGKSRISFDDFAIAMLDELEEPRHIKRRFTVGY